jgi:subfamily B ATP-binding cassette protein MsbA
MSKQKRLLAYIMPYKLLFIASFICGAIVAGSNGYIGVLTKKFKAAIDSQHPEAVFWVAALYVLIYIPRGLALFWQNYWVAKATNKIATDLRTEIYAHIQRMSLSFFERNRTGHLMSRITQDVGLIQNGAGSVIDMLTDPIMLIGGIGVMFYVSWKLALVVLVFVPVLSITIGRIGRRIKKLTIGLQGKLADVTSILEETIAGVRIVKSFVMESHEVKRFKQRNEESLSYALKSAKRSAVASSVVELITALGVGAMIVVGGMLVASRQLSAENLIFFATIGFFVSASAKRLTRLVVIYQQVMAGMDRVFEILDQQPDLSDKPDAKVLDRLEGAVEFRNVSFAYYEGPPVLEDISFTIEPGQVVAAVGPSGAGKSTLANLIPRFYDVTDGAVIVDGYDIRDVTTHSLRSQIGIVPQETVLFGGTIRENIAYGKIDATDEEIIAAAKAANG